MSSTILSGIDPFTCASFGVDYILLILPAVMVGAFGGVAHFIRPSVYSVAIFQISGAMVPNYSASSLNILGGLVSLLLTSLAGVVGVNLMGLIPLSLAYSAHMFFCLIVALPLWGSVVVSSILFSTSNTGAGLVPFGAPLSLSPLLCILETVSVLMRPISLSLRLCVNVGAGHAILGILAQLLISSVISSVFFGLVSLSAYAAYLLLEVGVGLVQGYILSTLISLYGQEHPNSP